MTDYTPVLDMMLSGDGDKLVALVKEMLDGGMPAHEVLNKGLIAGMDVIGGKMESGEMFIPEVIMSAQAMGCAVEILKPLLSEEDTSAAGTIVLGTVKGDLHDIGKNLVHMMLESAGFNIIEMGVDVAPESFVEAAKEHNADIVALSALLTTTMPMMRQTVQTFEESGFRDKVKILVGGAPVNQEFADEIGADGYAPDAGSATKLAKSVMAAG